MSKIRILAIPSDQYGVGKFRVMGPYTHLQENYGDDFHIDIKYTAGRRKKIDNEFFAKSAREILLYKIDSTNHESL